MARFTRFKDGFVSCIPHCPAAKSKDNPHGIVQKLESLYRRHHSSAIVEVSQRESIEHSGSSKWIEQLFNSYAIFRGSVAEAVGVHYVPPCKVS
ncbi:hypothetical protein ACH5RR_023514 [Cinchona calisaya]|uniref:Uncharacterized protein n=1 Tax=Cinchona calisaya TaxID=153742 RepID=A0ABD2ZAV9_9GENT